ncbi:MAG: hypothetical protein A2062_05030 [Omnitrophica WOR_2 bacterium GWA2_44_7]|nr:MAG: hypothetical protein A2062_05030 [Omnitrophica WOR_2 bacterium GWA2_44_7]
MGLLIPCKTPAFAEITDGLILYYSFDTNEGGHVTDESGGGHSGTIYGAAYTSAGRFSGAYRFDGQDDYILAGDLGYHETGAISFWIYADAVENWRNPFSTDYASWDDNIRFEISSAGYLSGGGHGLGRGDLFTATLQPKRWYHVAYVWDKNNVYGYLDGELKFKNPHPDPNSLVHPDLPLTAGEYKQTTLTFANVAIGNGYSLESQRYWKGMVDEARIYERPLNAAEVLTLYRGEEAGLVLHYTFDKNSGAEVHDDSNNGHTGTVMGASYSTNGKNGGAYFFDGLNDAIKIPKSGMLDVKGQITLCGWYNIYDTKQGPIIEWNNGNTSGAHMWVNVTGYQWQGAGSGANFVDTQGNDIDHVINTGNASVNQWHHIAVTYDDKTGDAAVYIDGALANKKNLGIFTPQTSYDIYIGRRPNERSFHGLIDDIRVYNRILSAVEIRNLCDGLSHGIVYQNFEAANGSGGTYGWPINDAYGVSAGLSSEQVHSGSQAWKFTIPYGMPSGVFGGTAVAAQIQQWHTNVEPQRHDRMDFWIWANPSNNAPNTVAVKFFDHNKYVYDPQNDKDGFWVWTTKQAEIKKWTKLSVLFTQLPSDFELNDIDKIEFYNYWDGTYYVDDIAIVGEDRVYQAFEPWSCPSSNPGECAWSWDGGVVSLSSLAQESTQSLKLVTTSKWGGIGIKSQEKRCDSPDNCLAQDFWHVNLAPQSIDPELYDHLTFWVREYGQNRLANNMAVKFFDHKNYFAKGFEIWTKRSAEYGRWTRLAVPFSELPDDFKLEDSNKIELIAYWPGTYYFDDIRAAKTEPPVIDTLYLSSGIVSWKPAVSAVTYTLQQSTQGADGPWQTIYSGSNNLFVSNRLNKAWLRLRWQTAQSSSQGNVAYYSDWSDTVEYQPKLSLIKKEELIQQGVVDWTFIPQAGSYEIQEGNSRFGAWKRIYLGTYKVPPPLWATQGKWYRVRPVRQNTSGTILEAGVFSPAILYDPAAFVKANGTALREKATGPLVSLRGVNLGNAFLLEPWMFFGSNSSLEEDFPDDYSMTQALTTRADIGGEKAKALKRHYQQTYLQEEDMDNLARMGINFIRLPMYYETIRSLSDNGQWQDTAFDFSALDRIVEYCGNRGIYVLLDLHGAPGGQSKEMHTGRKGYNKLFDPANEIYRERLLELWKAIALHYKNDTTVIGYDLLNEPFGAITKDYYPQITDGYQALWNLYDRIYDVIRDPLASGGASDSNHLIVMESIPSDNDWDTLPNPAVYGWNNLMYQFHYYGFTFDENG